MSALLLAAVVAIVASASPAGEVILVEQGRPTSEIAIPDDASPTVRHAAAELAAYLLKMSGAEVPVVDERREPAALRIDVGPTERARQTLPDGLLGREERVFIEAGPKGVTICGGGDRGTLFAVYRFLERLGCRWLAPDPELEYVPARSTVSIAPMKLDSEPVFTWRFFKGAVAKLEDWGVKMGMNGLYLEETSEKDGGCCFWPDEAPSVHAYHDIIPNETYFDDHPEWFPMIGGHRVPGDLHGRQLCVTAEGLADEFAANVVQIFDAHPGCRLMSISPNDGRGWCECPECEALDQRLCGGRTTQQALAGEPPFRGDRVFWFANEVAVRVARKHPDKKLLVLAYINYAEPPDSVRLHPNVVPFLCHYAPADYSRPISDPESEPNRQFNALLRRWADSTPNVLIYSYVSKSMWWGLPRPVLRPFAADIKHFHDLGIRRYYCQSSLSDWALDGPLYYVIARLLWDPAADPQAIADKWIECVFGPAADDMKAFYAAVDAAVRKTGRPYSDNPPRDVPGLFDRRSLDAALDALDAAERAATDAQSRRRVDEVARRFRYGYWMIEALSQRHRFDQTADPAAGEAAVAARDRALQFYNHSRAAERTAAGWSLCTEMGVLGSGFGEAETKAGRRCWNSDETGVGDGDGGWATFIIAPEDLNRPVEIQIDVWGESPLRSVVVNSEPEVWNRVAPEQRLSGKPQWETLVFRIPAELMDASRAGQKIGFGGGDSQNWIAEIRVSQP